MGYSNLHKGVIDKKKWGSATGFELHSKNFGDCSGGCSSFRWQWNALLNDHFTNKIQHQGLSRKYIMYKFLNMKYSFPLIWFASMKTRCWVMSDCISCITTYIFPIICYQTENQYIINMHNREYIEFLRIQKNFCT